jgi:hypothetical protein
MTIITWIEHRNLSRDTRQRSFHAAGNAVTTFCDKPVRELKPVPQTWPPERGRNDRICPTCAAGAESHPSY